MLDQMRKQTTEMVTDLKFLLPPDTAENRQLLDNLMLPMAHLGLTPDDVRIVLRNLQKEIESYPYQLPHGFRLQSCNQDVCRVIKEQDNRPNRRSYADFNSPHLLIEKL
jgi:Uma2 family endonuclease